MTTDRFHKASKDGITDVLREATKRECNGKDEQGMTPTLYAAFHGHLDALRLLCGRGGDPNKQDIFGNTALHLAAAQGHTKVVSFLANFGANIYAVDIDQRTPQVVAGVNGREEVLRFLDDAAAKLESTDKKKTKALKERAKKDWTKLVKEYNKLQEKKDKKNNIKAPTATTSLMNTIRLIRPSSSRSLTNLSQLGANNNPSAVGQTNTRISYSGLTMPKVPMGTVQRKALSKMRQQDQFNDDGFKISEIEDGKRSVRLINGISSGTEILYSGSLDGGRRGKLENGLFNGAHTINEDDEDGASPRTAKLNGLSIVRDEDETDDNDDAHNNANSAGGTYTEKNLRLAQNRIGGGGTLTRSLSQPDFINQLGTARGSLGGGGVVDDVDGRGIMHEPASFFVRPGVGSLAFRKSITNTLAAMSMAEAATEESSIGSAGSLAVRQPFQAYDDDLSYTGSSDDENACTPIERFLTAFDLVEYLPMFEEQKIDLETLLLLTESDLKSLNIKLGPYRKLVNAIAERKNALENPGEVRDSML